MPAGIPKHENHEEARAGRGVAQAAQPVHLFVDEGWHLLQYASTAADLWDIARRFRKHYAAIHLATRFGQGLVCSPDACDAYNQR